MQAIRKILFPVDFLQATITMVPLVKETAHRFNAAVAVLNAFNYTKAGCHGESEGIKEFSTQSRQTVQWRCRLKLCCADRDLPCERSIDIGTGHSDHAENYQRRTDGIITGSNALNDSAK